MTMMAMTMILMGYRPLEANNVSRFRRLYTTIIASLSLFSIVSDIHLFATIQTTPSRRLSSNFQL